jgi:hypothetical protein
MADNKFRYPPAPPNGDDTFSKNLVGFQITDGGGLTQGNFEFNDSISEKSNREFDVGVFSEPITLSDLQIKNVEQAKIIAQKKFSVYPNYDLTRVTNFAMYGSLRKRFSSSITKIINNFPAAIQVDRVFTDYTTGYTAYDIVYDNIENVTELKIDTNRIKNPFGIDYSKNSKRNLSLNPQDTHEIRNLTDNYKKYSLYLNSDFNTEYILVDFEPSLFLSGGVMTIFVSGNPFNQQVNTTTTILLKPNNLETEQIFTEKFDEVENFLLNRKILPKYTAEFQVIEEDISGRYFKTNKRATWPVQGFWNLDIISEEYERYLTKLNDIGDSLDEFKTDLISRFLTTSSFKDFDTDDQKMEKVLQLYGRSFDEIKKFIDALAHINSVNYTVKDDIPSQLLKNLSMTLGWNTDISPISNSDFLGSIFNTKEGSIYEGQAKDDTPAELNYQYYRNLILNSAYLFKSKGTHRSLEYILRFIGAPKALIEFNETIYLADGPVNIDRFNQEFSLMSGGTKIQTDTVLNPNDVFSFEGIQYTGFTTQSNIINVDTTIEDYPIDELGYPKSPKQTDNFFYEQGAGWFQRTPQHKSLEILDITNSTFAGQNANVQTTLEAFTYGQKYLKRYESFPYMNLGFGLTRMIDNQKSWSINETGLRVSNTGGYNSYYQVSDERLVLNAKNIEVFLNMGQGLVYDVWDMSRKTNYPIPSSGLTTEVQNTTGVDNTIINPRPQEKTFFEFAQTFYRNIINVRNRQNTNYKYPSLQQIYWDYLNSEEQVNIPSNKYTYQKMIDFTNGIGGYWTRLLEQMVPATTLWTGGQKMENSVFHRQKVVWRKQRGCEIVPVVCVPCVLTGQIFGYDCITKELDCDISANPSEILNNTLQNTLNENNLETGQCDLNSLVSQWYVEVQLGEQTILNELFFQGNGSNNFPTVDEWTSAVEENLNILNSYGLIYELVGTIVNIRNAGCDVLFEEESVSINAKVDISINCTV